MDIVEHVAKLEMQTQLLHVSILLICLSIVIWEIDCTTPIGTPLVYLVFSVSIKILLHIKNLFKKKKTTLKMLERDDNKVLLGQKTNKNSQ